MRSRAFSTPEPCVDKYACQVFDPAPTALSICTAETAKIGSFARANTRDEERHIRLLSMRRSEKKQRETRHQGGASTNDCDVH